MKVNYSEGTLFAIPLRNGGFAVGLIARATKKGPWVLAYLFGPKRDAIPTLSQVSELDPSSAIKIARISDLHLINGTWPILGRSSDFRRSRWPFPRFLRSDEIGRRAWAIEYAEDDPGCEIAQHPIAFGTSQLDDDAGCGAGFVEVVLTKILGGGRVSTDNRDAALPGGTGGRRPQWLRHFIYVPDRTTAKALAARLRRDGFEVESRLGGDDINWLVLARHLLPPGEEALERASERLTGLAEEVGGEYDGWEADVAMKQ